MYNNKTTNALKTIIKICYVALAFIVIGLWLLIKMPSYELAQGYTKYMYIFIPTVLTILSPAGYVALAFIDKLLTNVKEDKVFEKSTLKYLDVISYACVVASVIVAIALVVLVANNGIVLVAILSLAGLAFGAMFMALILKVIKKVFSKAIELKEENDLTI